MLSWVLLFLIDAIFPGTLIQPAGTALTLFGHVSQVRQRRRIRAAARRERRIAAKQATRERRALSASVAAPEPAEAAAAPTVPAR